MQTYLRVHPLALIVPALAACVSTRGGSFFEEGPVPPLMVSEKVGSEDVTPITESAFSVSDEFSPVVLNDRWVAFVTNCNGNLDIFSMDYVAPGSSGQAEIVTTSSNEKAPFMARAWAPSEQDSATALEGTCYYVSDGSGRFAIYSGELPRVSVQSEVHQGARNVNWPVVDASGERMLYSAVDGRGRYQIWLRDAQGVQLVADGQRAQWNPVDPNEFVYVARDDEYWQIWTQNLKTGSKQKLTSATVDCFDPIYSPDGKSIAYVSNQHGSSDIWIMSANGTRASILTEDGAADCQPVFDPSGRYILFASNRGETWDIWRIAAP